MWAQKQLWYAFAASRSQAGGLIDEMAAGYAERHGEVGNVLAKTSTLVPSDDRPIVLAYPILFAKGGRRCADVGVQRGRGQDAQLEGEEGARGEAAEQGYAEESFKAIGVI